MKYCIEICETIQELETKINNKIKSGWEPTGGIVFISDAWTSGVAQAMINKNLDE
jgi:hypothetical protein